MMSQKIFKVSLLLSTVLLWVLCLYSVNKIHLCSGDTNYSLAS